MSTNNGVDPNLKLAIVSLKRSFTWQCHIPNISRLPKLVVTLKQD